MKINKRIITINNHSNIEFISVYVHLGGGGTEKHFKFPVYDNIVQDVPVYQRICTSYALNEIKESAQQAIDNGTFDDIV